MAQLSLTHSLTHHRPTHFLIMAVSSISPLSLLWHAVPNISLANLVHGKVAWHTCINYYFLFFTMGERDLWWCDMLYFHSAEEGDVMLKNFISESESETALFCNNPTLFDCSHFISLSSADMWIGGGSGRERILHVKWKPQPVEIFILLWISEFDWGILHSPEACMQRSRRPIHKCTTVAKRIFMYLHA